MADARWLRISITTDGEQAEALAELLGRYIPSGIVVESAVKYNDAEDEGTPFGPVTIYGFIPVDGGLDATRQQIEESLWHLGQIQPVPSPQYTPIPDEDWMSAWKQHYQPLQIGKRILILPAWIEPPETKRVIVRIDPSMAFGTGTHPTTQLCLQLLENHTPVSGTVMDIGCGSGILSIAALKLGAERAIAVDIDPLSVKGTQENGELNGTANRMEIGLGSVREILAGKFSATTAPLVIANILAPVIIRLLDDGLGMLPNDSGLLMLSGIIQDQVPDVLKAARNKGFRLLEERNSLDWVGLVLQRN